MNKSKIVKIKVCDKITDFIKENFKEDIKHFEKKNKMNIEIDSDNSLIVPDYIIEFQNKKKKILDTYKSLTPLKNLDTFNGNEKKIKMIKVKKYNKKKFFKKKYFKKKN